jgi:hypothetical protein
MKKLIAGALTALTLTTSLSMGVTAAQADDWHGRGHYRGEGEYRGHRGPDAGALVGAGILGLAVGAAIAGHRDHHRSYDGPAPVYYRAPPPAYYNGPDYYGYADECRVYYRWDPYWGRYVEIERCY